MNEQKNPQAILRTFARLQKEMDGIKLYMVGPFPAQLQNDIETFLIPGQNVVFTGEVPYEQVAVYMKQADTLVMFSNYENMPCVILEALCCGIPVISSNVGGVPEIINKHNGWLVPAGDEEALYNAMFDAVNNNDRFNRLEISSDASKRFSYSSIGKEIVTTYREIIS